tara:strand:+ start:6602 stop:8305 length:1704 start_codon:yes stop_codon:yes gene_type:complete
MSWIQSLVYSPIYGGLYKQAEESGHWRKLPSSYKGKDQSGAPVMGKTWVRKSRMKSFFKPYDHQKEFIRRVTTFPEKEGVIAAHGTGTGKTVSSVAAFEALKDKKKANRALVVVPAGLRNNFLEKGVKKFTDSKGVILKRAGKDVGDDVEYVITSYSAFRKNPDAFIDKYKPDVLIADEMHKVTNQRSQTFKALEHARDKIPRFMGLTASIVQNDPSDIAPILRIARSGEAEHPLGSKKFVKKFVKRMPSEKKGIFGGKTFDKVLVGQPAILGLLGKNVHYVEDLDADKKPRKEVQTVKTEMSKEQLKLYKDAMKGVDPRIQAKIAAGEQVSDKEAASYFVRLIHARRVSNSLHGHVPGMTLSQAAEKTPKIKKVLDDAVQHIQRTPDAQIIMYTNLVHGGVDVLEAGLRNRGINYGVFAGKGKRGVSERTRQQAVKDYQDRKNKVILITGAGAEGLSLGNTTMVQMVDGHYNPERINQAQARGIRAKGLSHRPKEKRKVMVREYVTTVPKSFWRMITFRDAEKSIDQFIYSRARGKERVNKQLRDVLAKRSKRDSQRSYMNILFGA